MGGSSVTKKMPVTPAIRQLRAAGVAFEGHLYDYVERGGTAHSAASLGVDEHMVIKTLVLESDRGAPLIVLMHGDREVSLQRLARLLEVRRVVPCAPEMATKHTGYLVGGTSPFGTKKSLPVYMEASISSLPRIFINGGKRGFLVELSARDLTTVLAPTPVTVAV
ncbi:MAG: aminoacyl-tRNA deacylase [Candidatus Eisenbacteria bacterium]|uniref:Cys-tRNA(Pro)/Cys-tRNA(Cys) deacylase n=1 Tax=Eiseniibacteriota bacterium TaxID=2212470 RepID=A0A956NDW1_UNCEI|nr:aminoacyl-tRNA deacylase [Candidatus Eisenbacteria bacterium]MCB9466447.1 aminoacyl-tRNA deacylase [Candidatus Eisenbacteria bacterium]